jgi:hypothetical protein
MEFDGRFTTVVDGANKIQYYIITIMMNCDSKKGGILAINTENLDLSLQIKCWGKKDDKKVAVPAPCWGSKNMII